MADETVGFVAIVTEDLKTIKVNLERQSAKIEAVRDALQELRLSERDIATLRSSMDGAARDLISLREKFADLVAKEGVQAERWSSQIAVNETNIKDLTERIKWLSRLVLGSLITGVVGGALAYLFRVLEASH